MELIYSYLKEPHVLTCKSSKIQFPPPSEFFEYFFITLALTCIGRALISH